jgi:hypothetical protein
LSIALALSAFTHLWNSVGFPDVFYDEGVYMRRAMHVLSSLGPQEAFFHDHPFFGQIFLAGVLGITGYPESLNPLADEHSMEMLYFVPRIWMGILAVVDTFLIYKIAERRYNRNVAVFASILFAVMPITWLLRRILLDSILLPFLLASILLAIYSNNAKHKMTLTLISGVLLGLSIFTKETMFVMIPLVAYLIYTNNNRSPKVLGLWFIPVVLIPMIWVFQSIMVGQFDLLVDDVLYQVNRHGQEFVQDFKGIATFFVQADPVLFAIGITGLVLAGIKRNLFILLWTVPFLIFLLSASYVQYFFWIPILPAFCIAAALLLDDITKRANTKKLQRFLPLAMVTGLGIFGLASTTLLISTNVSAQFEAAAFVAKYTQNDNGTTIVSSPVYSWIFTYVFDKQYALSDYRELLFYPLETKKVVLIADQHFLSNIKAGKELQEIYDTTNSIATFKGNVINYDPNLYPFTSMGKTFEGSVIEIRGK